MYSKYYYYIINIIMSGVEVGIRERLWVAQKQEPGSFKDHFRNAFPESIYGKVKS